MTQGLTYGPGWLEVANDVFNGVVHILSCRPNTSRMVISMAPSCRVALHCSYVLRVVNRAHVATYPHVLQVMMALHARTSYRP
jgi:hypothetical protein